MLLLLACPTEEPAPPPDGATDTGVAVDPCADPVVPDDVVTLETADGPGTITLFDVAWTYYGTDTTLEPQWEAARFELPHPAEVIGFAVQWTNLGPKLEPTDPVEAGLYPDFGYNGFDFDAPAPYVTLSRCAQDVTDGAWTEYVFDAPVTVRDPGLVYVAHHKARKSDPVWWMDDSYTDAYCATFDACDAAWNFPDLDPQYDNGVSVILPFDYQVRLYVRYTDDLDPSQTQFQPIDGPAFGSRTAWGDYDNDGWDDVVASGLTLWHNEGGSLRDVTVGSGLEAAPSGGAVWGDYDNDGCLDLFGINEGYTGSEYLLAGHCDGTFTDVTVESGITDTQDDIDCTDDPYDVESANTAAATWIDLDADGLLDLYLANMICWSQYTYYDDRVWHNLGGGVFEDWSFTRGFLPNENLSGRGATGADADGDGDVDLFVNNYTLHRNLYYENLGDGTFLESGRDRGLAGDNDDGYYGHTIGSAWGDIDNDGFLDMVHGNLAHPRFFDFSDKSKILVNDGTGSFLDVSDTAGLRYQETYSVPVLADFDHDGNLDLVLTAVYDGRPTDVYRGQGDGRFVLDSYHAGITTENGWGVSTADIDHDGDLDVATYSLFRNDGADGDWLQVGLIGDAGANAFGIGATVALSSDGAVRTRVLTGGTGQGGQDALVAHFGVPSGAPLDTLRVLWPGGTETVIADPPRNQRVWVRQSGGLDAGWARP